VHITKEYLLSLGLVVIFIITMFCGHFAIGVSNGISLGTSLPSSGWEAITTSLTWLVSALTFQLTSTTTVISWCLWIFIVVTIFIPIVQIIRGD
jgi:hypothetical protein